MSKVAAALGHQMEQDCEEETKESRNPFEQSFYKKQGIDFLNF